MRDLKSPVLLWTKAALFIIAGLMAAGSILLESPGVRNAVLLGVTVWCFARAYYFAFHVIEHYIDGDFRFTGLVSLARHAVRRRRG